MTKIIEIAHKRLSTIVIGGSVSLVINLTIYPVWAGEELHNSIVLNMEKLAHFLEGTYMRNDAIRSHILQVSTEKLRVIIIRCDHKR